MIPTTISAALAALKAARCPEDIFGNQDEIKDNYREWAKIVHEDMAPAAQKADAHEAFILLTKWQNLAEQKVARGTYGDKKPAVLAVFKTKTASYSVHTLIQAGDIADLYDGERDGMACWVKVCRSPKNNDLMKNEADILAALPIKMKPEHANYFPNLLDSFEAQCGKAKVRVNVFNRPEGMISLQNVLEAFPEGLDQKDVAWMWNRMLEAAHLLHVEGYVHSSWTPNRFLISPEKHTGMLIDFCYATNNREARAFSPAFKDLYPPEVFAKKTLDFGTDLYMIARIVNLLLGGTETQVPAGIPVAVAGLLRSCWLGPAHRANSAKSVHASFKEIRNALGWKKEFRNFPWPAKAT